MALWQKLLTWAPSTSFKQNYPFLQMGTDLQNFLQATLVQRSGLFLRGLAPLPFKLGGAVPAGRSCYLVIPQSAVFANVSLTSW